MDENQENENNQNEKTERYFFITRLYIDNETGEVQYTNRIISSKEGRPVPGQVPALFEDGDKNATKATLAIVELTKEEANHQYQFMEQ